MTDHIAPAIHSEFTFKTQRSNSANAKVTVARCMLNRQSSTGRIIFHPEAGFVQTHQLPTCLQSLAVLVPLPVPYVPLCHPFVERLIGTLRRECLDRTSFWTMTDLEAKLLDFQHYFNERRTHAGRQGHPPVTGVNADRSLANLSCYRWQKHCRGLYQTLIAA